MRRRFLGLALAALVVISSAAARDLKTTDGRQVARVAVVSRLGDTFYAVLETPRIFSVSQVRRGEVPVPDWKIDEHIEQRIGHALAARFSVVPLTAGEVAGRGVDIWVSDEAAGNTRQFGTRSDIDAYVVVSVSVDSSDFYTDSLGLVPIWGLGFYHLKGMLVDRAWVYAVFDVVVVDAKTGNEIARQRGRVAGNWNYASDIADDRIWLHEDKVPQPEQVALVRDAITSLVDQSVDWTLKKMELVR